MREVQYRRNYITSKGEVRSYTQRVKRYTKEKREYTQEEKDKIKKVYGIIGKYAPTAKYLKEHEDLDITIYFLRKILNEN